MHAARCTSAQVETTPPPALYHPSQSVKNCNILAASSSASRPVQRAAHRDRVLTGSISRTHARISWSRPRSSDRISEEEEGRVSTSSLPQSSGPSLSSPAEGRRCIRLRRQRRPCGRRRRWRRTRCGCLQAIILMFFFVYLISFLQFFSSSMSCVLLLLYLRTVCGWIMVMDICLWWYTDHREGPKIRARFGAMKFSWTGNMLCGFVWLSFGLLRYMWFQSYQIHKTNCSSSIPCEIRFAVLSQEEE